MCARAPRLFLEGGSPVEMGDSDIPPRMAAPARDLSLLRGFLGRRPDARQPLVFSMQDVVSKRVSPAL